MAVLTLQAPILETNDDNRKPAGAFGYRPACRHQRTEVVTEMIHPGSIFSESGPDWKDTLYCQDCGEPLYNAHQACDHRDEPSKEIPF